MAAWISSYLLLWQGFGSLSGWKETLAEQGRAELQHLRILATQPRFGACWSRALDDIDTRCRYLTADVQSRIALRFAHCHLESSARAFPSCPEGSEVSRCTSDMDAVAFNAYTEFFTHTYSICHYLQSEAWQHTAESTMFRLTESSAGVAEQLQLTRQMTEDLSEAQSATLLAQEEILRNGQELRNTLRDSAQGLRDLFAEMSDSAIEQQVALSEVFNKVAFLHNFLLLESHTLSSVLYNSAALCTGLLMTSTKRTAQARLILLGLVCVNVYLERLIYQWVLDSSHPEHQLMERVGHYVYVLRRVMLALGLLVLLFVALQYRDPTQDSLEVLAQLRETQRNLQEALQRAENLSKLAKQGKEKRERQWREQQQRREEVRRKREKRGADKDDDSIFICSMLDTDSSDLSHLTPHKWNSSVDISTAKFAPQSQDLLMCHLSTHNASVSPVEQRSSQPVYSILVEDRQQPRYSLRNRKSHHK